MNQNTNDPSSVDGSCPTTSTATINQPSLAGGENIAHQLYIMQRAHCGHLRNFGSRRLQAIRTNPNLYSSDTNLGRLLRSDPSHLDESTGIKSGHFFRKLFPDEDELVCVGLNPLNMVTDYRSPFDVAETPFSMIVPAYMTDYRGLTSDYPNGKGIQKISCRCLANTGDARFVVYCRKDSSLEDQAYSIIRLALEAPLVMVVKTAMGWLNAWYSVVGWPKRDVAGLRSRAQHFGSWSKTGIACHPYPFPGGLHNYVADYDGDTPIVEWTEEVHRAVYFDPAAIGSKIQNY